MTGKERIRAAVGDRETGWWVGASCGFQVEHRACCLEQLAADSLNT